MITAVSILVDSKGSTIGASFYVNGQLKWFKTEDLANSDMKVDNAIITKDGFVRAKSGSLRKELFNPRPTSVHQRDMSAVTKYLSQANALLYHGNKDASMIPRYGVGSIQNDYGRGFYLTPDIELGKEWAYNQYTQGDKGYLHTFTLNIEGLEILDLSCCNTLNWLAELIDNRSLRGTSISSQDLQLFKRKYKINTQLYDVLIGYRADDSYYNYVRNFIDNKLCLEVLESCMRFGKLGLQVFIKSHKAFKALNRVSVNLVEPVYAQRAVMRLKSANNECLALIRQSQVIRRTETYFIDIKRELRKEFL